jgi:hypothetical protein
MHDDQFGFSDKRNRQRVGKGQLARRRKIGGMENRFDKWARVDVVHKFNSKPEPEPGPASQKGVARRLLNG